MVPALFIDSGAVFASLGHASLAASLQAANATARETTKCL